MSSLINMIKETSSTPESRRITTMEMGEGGVWRVVNSCNKRKADKDPIDITEVISEYLPFDESTDKSYSSYNFFNMEFHRERIDSGVIYPSYDGRRLILEVGCDSIIYLLIAERNAPNHHRVFIQSAKAFYDDITTRLLASEVVKRTRYVETVAKYEMYFLMGMLSTASLSAWAMVTGSDVTVFLIQNKSKIQSYKKLASGLASEYRTLQNYAPTLHAKLGEFIAAERKGNWTRAGKELPGKVIADEKAQAQLAGILYGKKVLSSKAFTVWTAVSTVLIQAVVKSGTNSLDAYTAVVDKRYLPLINEFQTLDLNDPIQAARAAKKLSDLFSEAGVKISEAEAQSIVNELNRNPDKVFKSLVNLHKMIENFNRRTGHG